MEIPLNLIQPSPRPVRTSWDEDKMNELAQSIKEQGVIVPIKVRAIADIQPCPDHGWDWLIDGWYENYNPNSGYTEGCKYCFNQFEKLEWEETEEGDNVPVTEPLFEIIYGHRRVEACRRAGRETVQAFVEGMEDDDALVQALIENVVREDMSDVDKGHALVEMNRTMSEREIAKKIGLDRGRIHHLITLVKDKEIAEVFSQGIQESGVELLQPVRDAGQKAVYIQSAARETPEIKREFASKVTKENLSTMQTRRIAEAVKAAPTPELKRRLIETPYNPVIHNPEVVREVAKYPDRPKTAATGFEWESRPEVAAVFETLKQLEKRLETIESSLAEWKRTVDIGKFSPEGVPFFVGRLRRASGKLHTTARRIEDLAEWIGREHG